LSWLSRILRGKVGLPEIDLMKNAQLSPFLVPLVEGLTRENFIKALRQLDNTTLRLLGEEVANELDRREAATREEVGG
jgi:hypothetical protein